MANAIDEQIRIKTRIGIQRQNTPVTGIQRYHSAPLVTQRFSRHPLQLQIEVQRKLVPVSGCLPLENPQHTPVRIGFDVLTSHQAVQFVLVAPLKTNLAEVQGTAVIFGVNRRCLALVNTSHVAEDMT